MLFNSLHFLLFFPVVVLLFFSLKDRSRIYWLIAASCYFYMAFVPAYILILFFLILLDYAAGLMIARSQAPTRHLWLVLSIVGNVHDARFLQLLQLPGPRTSSPSRSGSGSTTPGRR